jgi:hypothetical protein
LALRETLEYFGVVKRNHYVGLFARFYLEGHTLLKIQEQVKRGRRQDECRMLNDKRAATAGTIRRT